MFAAALNRYQLIKFFDRKCYPTFLIRPLILGYKSVQNYCNLGSLPTFKQQVPKFAVHMRFNTKKIYHFASKLLPINSFQLQRAFSTPSQIEQLDAKKKTETCVEQQEPVLSNGRPVKSVYPWHTSGVAFLVSKHPLMKRLNQPKWSVLQSVSANVYGLDTYESKLRHTRVSSPLRLNLPDYVSDKFLNISQRYKHRALPAHTKDAKLLTKMAKKYRPVKGTSNATTSRPNGALSNTKRTINMVDNKSSVRIELDKPIASQSTKETYKMKRNTNQSTNGEKEDLKNLLGDILEKENSADRMTYVKAKVMKSSPLFKLVTNSMERRFNLHDRTFNKQLENPMMFKHPLAKHWQPTSTSRRLIPMAPAQSTGYKAKEALNRKQRDRLADFDEQ